MLVRKEKLSFVDHMGQDRIINTVYSEKSKRLKIIMKIYTLAFKRLCSDMIEMGCTNIPRHLETYNRQSSPYFQLKDRFQLHMRKASDGSRGSKA